MQSVRPDQRRYWSSAHLKLPLACFLAQGPNGRHLYMIQRIFGPSIQRVRDRAKGEADAPRLKQPLFQRVTALENLRVLGVCHGDFKIHSILLRLSNMDHASKREMLALPDLPRRPEVMRLEDS